MKALLKGVGIAVAIVLGLAAMLSAGEARKLQPVDSHLSFAVIGDTGTGEEPQFAIAKRMVEARQKTPFDFVIMLGDNIYGGGNPRLFKPRFEDPYRELLSAGVKFYAALGNHDAANAAAHVKYEGFNMGGHRYYSFVKGDGLIEFFVLDTNETKTAELRREQLTWLEDALRKSTAKWKVAYFHHAIYSSGKMHKSYLGLRAQIEPLFVKYGVNAVFSGHFHVYERTRPQKGIQYYIAGSGGKLMTGDLDPKSPFMAYGNDQIQVFLLVTAGPEHMRVRAITSEGKEIDESQIEHKAASEGATGN
jgi:3',5'-cyclic AMP phosphodiesterase CpdA